MSPDVVCFFDDKTNSASYVVSDPDSGHAAIIDPVLDFDPASGRTSTESAEKIVEHVADNNLTVDWIVETHVHADHLTASDWLKQKLGGKTGVGAGIKEVRSTFGALFNSTDVTEADDVPFDELFEDGATFSVGGIEATVMATPGHTPACVTYVIGDTCFTGDTLFMPDYGTARADFPGGDARTLYRSIQKVLALPDRTRLFLCHDYKAPGRDAYEHETTVAEQRRANVHVHDGISEDDFVKMRTERDATLGMPRLIIPSVQINMRAGEMPPAEDDGQVYLKVPLNRF